MDTVAFCYLTLILHAPPLPDSRKEQHNSLFSMTLTEFDLYFTFLNLNFSDLFHSVID